MKLEQRLCKCGCGYTFQTLPTSTNRFWSYGHVQFALQSSNEELRGAAEAHLAEVARKKADQRTKGKRAKLRYVSYWGD